MAMENASVMVYARCYHTVIASEAKQSRAVAPAALDCFVASLLAMTITF
jgi:hypothetical protein